jgi:hypothetical protein
MAVAKSPFVVLRDFISPKQCEQFCDLVNFFEPDYDAKGKPLKMFKHEEKVEQVIFDKLQDIIPVLEDYYDIKYKGTEHIMVEWFAEGASGNPTCENSYYLRKKWVRSLPRDLTGILFFSDYQDSPAFDSEYEVYGGKLEFPQHNFGFNPERGTLVIYPSVPHFINATAEVKAGELYQARIHICAQQPFLYDPSKFPGDYRTWFANL